ncbi:MAG: bifunctional molybdenum cofactor biosynthesis protein MoaC/MoaB [Ignavibacteria bacterium]|nr:bifunctional molybdenum cofactor biosynthesis protein MoaC/MoaB [Ignavibacteria bacterium]
MRDVSSKSNTLRSAKAVATLRVSPSTIDAIRSGNVPKTDPIGVAKVAGIQAAKNTSSLIPYCHQVPLDFVGVDIALETNFINITTEVKAIWKTGVEMEALVAASAAALTLYDMLKIIDDRMEILSTRLLEKKGGTSSMKDTGDGLKAAVLVLSDSVSGGEKEDRSGKTLVERLKAFRFQVPVYKVLPDVCETIKTELIILADKQNLDLIITTGGTGASMRDVTPESTLAVINRRLEGVEETLRRYGQDRLPTAMLSRGVVGVRGKTIIINLPGSSRAVEDGMNALFPAILHTFRMMRGEGH